MTPPLRRHEPARIAIVVNDPAFFMSHRVDIARAARDRGDEVHIATPPEPASAVARIEREGFRHHPIPMIRGHANPVAEMKTLRTLLGLFRRVRPDLAHLVTIKPVLYGGVAAQLAGVPAVVAAISGLGHVFSSGTMAARTLRRPIRLLYRRGLAHPNKCVIFQNRNDEAVMRSWGVRLDGQSALIPGSGVHLDQFDPARAPERPPLVVMIARMLHEKGVGEFVEAAGTLKRAGLDATFAYLGAPDPANPMSVGESTLERWKAGGAVEFLGHRDDVPEILARASVVALPSHYGEGLPKALIEAAAAGRPVVTTDMPGCRDAVEPGRTGILIPPRDAAALAGAIRSLLEDPAAAARMGRAGRALAQRRFSVEDVVARHLDIYGELIARARAAESPAGSPARHPSP